MKHELRLTSKYHPGDTYANSWRWVTHGVLVNFQGNVVAEVQRRAFSRRGAERAAVRWAREYIKVRKAQAEPLKRTVVL